MDTEEKGRSGSFLQVDQSNIFTNNSMSNSVEVMNIGVALDKYHWVKDYMWNVVKPDADKYTAKTALREEKDGIKSGYFVRSLLELRKFSLYRHVCLSVMRILCKLHIMLSLLKKTLNYI